ncbi:hypothetical protein L596_019082 [Steinernema carpocapsae]|uniref:VWFA domain-containing protein n=1 Tax=Steinernema carpocapsae TaxID=34508 RepID=A0A4U5N7Q8_STECR|nr:hypothetical protein L596_019082 [Steinernema carpocapsae]
MFVTLLLLLSIPVDGLDLAESAFFNRYERSAHLDTSPSPVKETSATKRDWATSGVPHDFSTPAPLSRSTSYQCEHCQSTTLAATSLLGEERCWNGEICPIENLWIQIVILIDQSKAMGTVELKEVVASLKTTFKKVNIGQKPQNTQVALLTYKRNVTVVGKLDKYNSRNDFFDDLNTLKNTSDNQVNLLEALKEAQRILQLYGRKNTRSAVLVIASEYDVGNHDAHKLAYELKESSISIIAVAQASVSGGNVHAIMLKDIASPGMFFDSLQHLDILRNALCYVNCFCPTNTETYKSPFNVSASLAYGECLRYSKSSVDRENAELFCRENGGHLVHVKSISKHEKLASYVAERDAEFQIGWKREGVSQAWKWDGNLDRIKNCRLSFGKETERATARSV